MSRRAVVLRKMLFVFFIFLVINFVGAAILCQLENLDYTDGFYLSMSASTATGYGNVCTNTVGGKWFISFFQMIGLGAFFYLLALVTIPDEDIGRK